MITGHDLEHLCQQAIYPYVSTCLQGASYDLHLGNEFYLISETDVFHKHTPIRLHEPDVAPMKRLAHTFILEPGAYALACTRERVKIPTWAAARVEGKSSLGRQFQFVHVTAGFIDPGFAGNITLELYNPRTRPVIYEYGDPVAQICFYRCSQPTQYKGKYKGDGVEASRYHLNFPSILEES